MLKCISDVIYITWIRRTCGHSPFHVLCFNQVQNAIFMLGEWWDIECLRRKSNMSYLNLKRIHRWQSRQNGRRNVCWKLWTKLVNICWMTGILQQFIPINLHNIRPLISRPLENNDLSETVTFMRPWLRTASMRMFHSQIWILTGKEA